MAKIYCIDVVENAIDKSKGKELVNPDVIRVEFPGGNVIEIRVFGGGVQIRKTHCAPGETIMLIPESSNSIIAL